MRYTLILLLLLLGQISISAHPPQWITAFENQNATNTWICFQKEFQVNEVPSKAIAKIAVDSKYWLWINGKMVVWEGAVKRGPNPQDTYYDEVDMASFLNQGENTIAVLVWYFGKEGFSYNPSGSGALFFDCKTEGFTLQSDASWKSILHPAFYNLEKPEPNFRLSESNIGFDARIDINGWEQPKSPICQHWAAAKELGKENSKPWNKLHHRIIPMWKDFGLKKYISEQVLPGEDQDTLVCRLPYNAQITPFMEVEATEGKHITLQTDGYHGGSAYNVRGEYITKQGIQQYESLGWMNGENVFYIYPKGVQIRNVMYRETGYDTAFEGYFKCNVPFFNELWKKAQRTLYITMRDTYMDCPDRERAQWWGDAVNESGEAFYALSASSHLLMKKGMYELIGWQRPTGEIFSPIPSSNYHTELPGQMLASTGYFGFWNYYQSTGDLQPIRDLYPGIQRYLNVWQKNTDGTVKFRAGEWTWGDWGTDIDFEVLFNAWYYIALKGQLNMAKALNLNQDAARINQEMKELKTAFNKVFWTGKEYRHPQYKLRTDDRVHALAVVGGLADKEKYPAILNVLKAQEHASPYMEKYVIEALFQMNAEEYGLTRLKKRFQEMVEDPIRSTLYEGWSIGPGGFGGGTTNHAWSGGGLTIMSQYVCGVSPLTPGYESCSIRPQPGNIQTAETLVPTVKGNIKVNFQNNKQSFSLSVETPTTMKAVVRIPVKGSQITANGELVWKRGKFINGSPCIEPNLQEGNKYVSFSLTKGGKWNFISK